MPYADKLIKVSHIGTFLSSQIEQFNFGMWLEVTDDGPETEGEWLLCLQKLALDMAADFTANWADINTTFTSTVAMSHIKLAHVAADGSTLQTASQNLAPMVGAGGGSSLPPEVSTVVSMYGYPANVFVADRGRKRGRFYLPPPTTSFITATGRLSETGRNAYRSWALDIINAYNANTGAPLGLWPVRVVVASQVAGLVTPVTRVAVGDVLDAQRRRRNALDEVYSLGNVS